MKGKHTLLYILLLASGGLRGQLPDDRKLVDLRGQICTTVITNNTADTLKLETRAFYYTPYYETNIRLIIPPGLTDSLKVSLAYPDFISMDNYNLKFYNAPGRRIHASVHYMKTGNVRMEFSGDLALENDYYMAYQNHFKGTDHEHRPYYLEAAKLADLTTFPRIADSINNIALNFLRNYPGALPEYFKPFEESRLTYNAACRKYNILMDRQIKAGKQPQVGASYFDFERSLPLSPENPVFTTSHIYYLGYSLLFRSGMSSSMPGFVTLLDSLVKPGELSDAMKIDLLSRIYGESKPRFDSIFSKLAFYDIRNKYAADSIITLRKRQPIVGEPAPRVKLADINGDSVSLADFKGKPVIINFWASWCGGCLQEFPHENSLYKKYSPKGLVIVNICVDTDREKWKSLSRTKDLRMINLYATTEEYRRLKMRYVLGALPRSILLGKDGTVLSNYYKKASLVTGEEVEELL